MPPTILFGSNDTRTVIDNRTLAEAQAERLNALKRELAAEIAKGITYSGKPLQIDDTSTDRMTAMVLRAQARGLPPGFAWRMGDNTALPIATPAEMIALADAAALRVMALRAAYWTAADAVRATTTREDADAVQAAWPK